jgi:hypothetical protein
MAKSVKLLNSVKQIGSLMRNGENSHIWQFSRVGGVNRVNLLSGNDLKALDQLDQKLWTALSCPVVGLEIDSKTLQLIDTDGDNRIRVPEVLEAVRWITSIINDSDDLLLDNKSLPLSAINTKTEEGKILLASAKQILTNLGKPDQKEIYVEETSDITSIFAETKFNGDGVITEDSAANDEDKKLITNIISSIGSVNDRSGKPGINIELIETFFQYCEEYSEWNKFAEDFPADILPFGSETEAALQAYFAVKSKIDDYFLRCRLSEYDPASASVFNLMIAQYEAISAKDLSGCSDEIAALPIAKTNEKKVLHLNQGLNPLWENALQELQQLVVNKLFPQKKSLTVAEWESVAQKFNKYNHWKTDKKGEAVETLGLEVVRNILESGKKEVLLSLIEQDLALETEANNILIVDKLTRFYCDIYRLLRNFVNFSDFYAPDSQGVFQAGKLFIDQRCCDLCIRVNDMPKHNTMAGFSGICLIYCDCVSRLKNERMTIVAALTDGDIDNITLGRNAVFYDQTGGDWDATIIKIIDNPISIRQAFWSPYKKVSRFVSEQIEKVASSKEKAVHSSTTSGVEKVAIKTDAGLTHTTPEATVVPTPAAPVQAFDIGKFVGIFAALSLALGAIGSVIMSVLTGFLKLNWWQMPIAIVGIMLTISLPSMVLAFLKLRKRNLAPVLDANGWAINAKLTINIIFGRTLTHLATLPANSKVNLIDPFQKKKNPLLPILIIAFIIISLAILVLWYLGYTEGWLDKFTNLFRVAKSAPITAP